MIQLIGDNEYNRRRQKFDYKLLFRYVEYTFLYIFLFFLPVHKNRIYCMCTINSFLDKYDILNCGSSNLLKFINYYCSIKNSSRTVIYLEYYDDSRMPLYLDFSKKALLNNIELRFVPSCLKEQNIFKRFFRDILNFCIKKQSKLWLIENPREFQLLFKNVRNIELCMNYFISCKNDYTPGSDNRLRRLNKMLTCGLLNSQIVSSSEGITLDSCIISGFPRNDTLFYSDKKKYVLSWIEEQIGYRPRHIFLYVPTFRDWENGSEEMHSLLGYSADSLASFLSETKSVFIYKLHSHQNVSALSFTNSMIAYPNSFEFSLYDLMSVSDCLIGDYSSVMFDFLLLNKPIIYNLYDYQKYLDYRGMSFDPYELMCAGPIVTNWSEMSVEMNNVVNNIDNYLLKRLFIRNLIHKYPDFNSSNRVYSYINQIM